MKTCSALELNTLEPNPGKRDRHGDSNKKDDGDRAPPDAPPRPPIEEPPRRPGRREPGDAPIDDPRPPKPKKRLR